MHGAGRTDEAEDAYLAILDEDPSHPKALLNLASIRFDAGDFDEAARLSREALTGAPHEPAAELLLSRVAYLRGDPDEGFAHLCRAHAFAPNERSIVREYADAARRRYWTYRPDEYQRLFALAQEGKLPPEQLSRLCHQSFSRFLRPGLIECLLDATGGDSTAVTGWAATLDKQAAEELGVLARNFGHVVRALHGDPAYAPRPARLTYRNETVATTPAFGDFDPLTHGSLELIGDDGEAVYLPFANIRDIAIGEVGAVMDVLVTCTDGESVKGYLHALYLLTEFSRDGAVREGRSTVPAHLMPGVTLPLGLREWRSGDALVPVVNLRRIEFVAGA